MHICTTVKAPPKCGSCSNLAWYCFENNCIYSSMPFKLSLRHIRYSIEPWHGIEPTVRFSKGLLIFLSKGTKNCFRLGVMLQNYSLEIIKSDVQRFSVQREWWQNCHGCLRDFYLCMEVTPFLSNLWVSMDIQPHSFSKVFVLIVTICSIAQLIQILRQMNLRETVGKLSNHKP